MKLANMGGDRFKERPASCLIDSHALMVRGGYIKNVANGVYSQYPIMKRISRKIVEMVRDINALRWISLGDVSRIFKITKGANLSREFIRKAQIIT